MKQAQRTRMPGPAAGAASSRSCEGGGFAVSCGRAVVFGFPFPVPAASRLQPQFPSRP